MRALPAGLCLAGLLACRSGTPEPGPSHACVVFDREQIPNCTFSELPGGGWQVACTFGSFPPVRARLLEVGPLADHVTLDRGADAGVGVGFVFEVFQASTYRGRVIVEELRPARSLARVLFSRGTMVAGDEASTQL